MPSSLQAQMTRSAISPRLAIRTFRNIYRSNLPGTQGEERLAVFDRLAALNEALDDLTGGVGLDLVHELHGFDDAENLSVLDLIADFHKGRRARRGRLIEGADDGRLDDVQPGVLVWGIVGLHRSVRWRR